MFNPTTDEVLQACMASRIKVTFENNEITMEKMGLMIKEDRYPNYETLQEMATELINHCAAKANNGS